VSVGSGAHRLDGRRINGSRRSTKSNVVSKF
jgi:hypothetical protein